jgi:translocation and assembly module TamB
MGLRRWMRRSTLLLGFLGLVAIAVVAWTLYTQTGARFVLERVARAAGEGVRYEGLEGSLGGTLRVKLIEVKRPGLYARVEDFEMSSALLAAIGGRLTIHDLHARVVEVRTASTSAAAQVPVSFAAPYALRLEQGRVGELRLGALGASRDTDLVVRDIFVRGEGDASHWQLDEARAGTEFGSGRVSGRIDTLAPFNLQVNAAFEGVAAGRPYKAAVVARGTLKDIEAKFDAELSGDKGSGRLVLEPFEKQPLRALELKAGDVDLAKHGLKLRTRLALDARLAAAGGAFSGPVRIDNAEPGPWDRQRLPFVSAAARITATLERVDLEALEIALAGSGRASGRAHWQHGAFGATLDVIDVDLVQLHGALQRTQMGGRVAVEGDAESQRFDLALKDPRFEVEARVALAQQKLDVETARVRTGGGVVEASGSLALAAAREFRFEGAAKHFDPAAFVRAPKGDVNLDFTLQGHLSPEISGEARVDIAPGTFSGLAVSGRVNVAGDAHRVAAADVDVTLGEARITAKGALGREGDALDLALHTPDVSPLANLAGLRASGKLDGEAHLAGTFAEPNLRATIAASKLAVASAAHFDEINATLAGTGPAHRLDIQAKLLGDSALRVAFEGGLDRKAGVVAWNGRLETLALAGRGAFVLAAPVALSASRERVEMGEAALKGEWGEARLATLRWTPGSLDLAFATAGVQLQSLARSLRLESVPRSSLVMAGELQVHAAETFEARANVHRVSGDLRVGEPPVPLGLHDITLKAEVVQGAAKASLLVAGERIGTIRGEGSAQVVRGDSGWELARAAPVEGRLALEETGLDGFTPWLGNDARLQGRIDAQLAVGGTGADPQISGSVRARDIAVREPQSGFEIEKGALALRLSGHSIAIEKLEATAPWHPSERALQRIAGLKVPADGGRLSAEGAIDLIEHTGAIRVKLDRLPVTQLATRFLALSGEARLEAGASAVSVVGELKADAGWIGALAKPLPNVSDDVVVVRAADPVAAQAKRDPIRIDLRLGLGDRLFLQGRGLDTRLAGEVHLTGTPGAGLRASGSIRAIDGTYDGYGQKLTIERGVLTFNGPIDNPQLNVLALRKGLPVEAGVEVLGTTTRPRVRLVSSPDVPEPEKLSWLVLGRGGSDSSMGDSAVVLAAATAMLGEAPGSQITRKLGFDDIRIGRSDANSVLGVLPQSTVAGRTSTASASEVVSVGRRINDRLHVSYEQGMSDAEGALRLTWQVTRQFQVLVRAGYLPGLDLVYRWTFK